MDIKTILIKWISSYLSQWTCFLPQSKEFLKLPLTQS